MPERDFIDSLVNMPETDPDYFRLIPQDGVNHKILVSEPRHNAIWDMNIRKSDGRVFFSVCGEGDEAVWAKLYEFDGKNNRFIHHFDFEKKVIQQDIAIRASKFHTCIDFMEDGRLIMVTHTTARAPQHPAWMPQAYANHQWEGFQGSNLIIYDPETGTVDNRGVIAPYETLYGGAYSARCKTYFGIGMMTGRGYAYNVETGQCRCLGQVCDPSTCRLLCARNGNIYSCTGTGVLFRYDAEKQDVIYSKNELPERSSMEFMHEMPDGRLLLSSISGQELYLYDPAADCLKSLGRYSPEGYLAPGHDRCYGFDFDSSGRIWYATMTYDSMSREIGCRLHCWDVFNGKKSVDYGFIGTPATRTPLCVAELMIYDDVIYIADGNHMLDPVGIVSIDTRILGGEKPFCPDSIIFRAYKNADRLYPGNDLLAKREHEYAFFDYCAGSDRIRVANPHCMLGAKPCAGLSFWQQTGRENSPVLALEWTDNNHLVCHTGGASFYRINVAYNNGEAAIESIIPCEKPEPCPIKAKIQDGVPLPFVPGRQYLAAANASVAMSGGRVFAGTRDMMTAVICKDKVKSTGAACTSGPVLWLTVTPDKNKVYGVAGHKSGIGNLFTYSEDEGLIWLGSVPFASSPCGRRVCCTQPTVCELSPNGQFLAIGAGDLLGGIVIIGQ